MAWPPPVLSTNRTNATAQQDTHPQDHNAANLAINDIVARLTGTGPGQIGNLGRLVNGPTLSGSLPIDGTLTQLAGALVLPAGSNWLVIHMVELSSTAALAVRLRMYGLVGPTFFDHFVAGAVNLGATFAGIATGGANVTVYGQNSGTQPATYFGDSTNHVLFAIGLT